MSVRLAHLFYDSHGLVDEALRVQLGCDAANIEDEVPQDTLPCRVWWTSGWNCTA